LAGFDYRAHATADALRASAIPVLLIHGTEDDYVPPEMSERIAQAAERAELFTVEGAKHGQSVYYAPKEYEETILRFLKKHMLP